MRHIIKWLLWIPLLLSMLFAQERKLFVVGGQSNAAGGGDSATSIPAFAGTAFEYSAWGDSLVDLIEPVGFEEMGFNEAVTGSSWSSFCHFYHQYTGDTLFIVQIAKRGTACHPDAENGIHSHWGDGGGVFDSAMLKIRMAMQHTGLPVSGIIWTQGERDAKAVTNAVITQQQYQEALEDLIGRFRDSLSCDLPFYLIQTGTDTNWPDWGFAQVRVAQERLANQHPLNEMVYDLAKKFPELGLMSNSFHYNQAGYNDIGKQTAFAIDEFEQLIQNNSPALDCNGICQKDMYESNEWKEDARWIPHTGISQRLKICPAGDIDWFQFQVDSSQSHIQIVLTNAPVDMQVSLYDNVQDLIDSTFLMQGEQLIFTQNGLIPGTYFLKIHSPTLSFDSTQSYSLRVLSRSIPYASTGSTKTATRPTPIAIAPNPFTSHTQISWGKQSFHRLKIWSIEGKLILSQDLHGRNFEWNASNLPQGMYLIQLQSNTETVRFRVVKNE